MDGTLIDSTKCVEAIWGRWGKRNGIALDQILAVSHGRRSSDTIQEIAPLLDAEVEADRLEQEEMDVREGIEAVPGSAARLCSLPEDRWAVVTSASRALAALRLACAGLPAPKVVVGADDVREGKPSPEGFLLAAKRLGFQADECLVFEDTPAGIEAARAAGMPVVGVTTTYSADRLLGAACVQDFRDIEIVIGVGELEVRVGRGAESALG
jgi:HAD superfamily hydrolase (TIGR01509 family)